MSTMSRESHLARESMQTYTMAGPGLDLMDVTCGDLTVMLHHVQNYKYESLKIDNWSNHWVISFVKQGTVRTTCMGDSRIARAGDVMIHPPYLDNSEYSDEPGLHQYIVFNATLASRIDLLRLYPIEPVVSIAAPDELSVRFDELLKIWSAGPNDFWGLQILGLTSQILSIVLLNWKAAGSRPRPAAMMTQTDRFAGLIVFMSRHIDEKLNRTDLADHLHLHPVYLDRAFHEAHGMSSMQMLREMRLRKAKNLIETTDLTLDAIAGQCGFGAAPYLIRVFSSRFGTTPNDYRKGFKSAMNSFTRSL